MIKKRTLNNNLDILLIPRNNVRSVSIIAAVRAGSAHEPERLMGISHLIEHSVFRGTIYRNMEEIKRPIEEFGGSLNAFTGKNLTAYYAKVPLSAAKVGFEIIMDIIFNAEFNEEDIEKEKKIVLDEIAMYEDEPVENTFEQLHKIMFSNEFAFPILGTKESVSKLTSSILKKYYMEKYTPENIVLALVGPEEELESLSSIAKDLIPDRKGKKCSFKSPVFKDEIQKFEKEKEELSQIYIAYSFKAPSKMSKDFFSTAIMKTFLGSGMSSLLFTKIREELGLAYEITADYSAYNDNGTFTIFAATVPENFEKLNNAIYENVRNINTIKKIENWIEYGKKRLSGKYMLETENGLNFGFLALDYYLSFEKLIDIDAIVEKINLQENDNIINIANKIFNQDPYISIVKPK
ncbi:Predicted Zn-dependent peptidase [Marinitoga hydrogenitolerans DSM 16785]|uniref:Predicted Zn-dependent peptidase n=1 Tax=Marinitoga hydrogenitolerans (strain DSM 16785 / JCM 12826 / AT1271) TaxID=1122195 RepID=A0A1M4Y5Q3_MARH1|nr:pitrilysin family protein [Marinitoga hydrogenitolerans]SHF01091.1 Predicted Zn-dependent peptidase [Marinitoga hydrogenitolerans DSM 16785]